MGEPSKTARPDRTRTALALLAAAGSAGLTTPDIVHLAGGEPDQVHLSWYGTELRRAKARGWIDELGRESAGWQKGKVIRWIITEAGRARLAHYDSTRKEAEARRERVAARTEAAAARLVLLDGAALRLRLADPVPPEEKYDIARSLRDEGCTLQEIADVFGISDEWARQILAQGTWKARRAQPRGEPE